MELRLDIFLKLDRINNYSSPCHRLLNDLAEQIIR